MMKRFILAIGSNSNGNVSIKRAMLELKKHITDISFTAPLHNEAIGITGSWFDNLLAYGHTDMTLNNLTSLTKEIENICGNTAELRRNDIVMMDIDILLYDDVKLRKKDWDKTYIKKLIENNNIITQKEQL